MYSMRPEQVFKASQFFDGDIEWDNEEKVIEAKFGSKYELIGIVGEGCFGVIRPQLCICDITTGLVTVLDQVPKNISPSFRRNQILGVAIEHPTFSPDRNNSCLLAKRADGPHQAAMKMVPV
ncbi:unnamed protein product, partial [Mesorhabditis belari]|uniref:Uncharacterized protein n=1 Tax=Mesorhabditis belari TaxID=2138241 RepID=A0AAF3F5M7_9BILA